VNFLFLILFFCNKKGVCWCVCVCVCVCVEVIDNERCFLFKKKLNIDMLDM
jgi:hypothetical protein